MAQEPNIFSGLKVVDLASYIAGPAATTILSDFGAEVMGVRKVTPSRAPRLGEHSAEVLVELGAPEQVAQLAAAGVVRKAITGFSAFV